MKKDNNGNISYISVAGFMAGEFKFKLPLRWFDRRGVAPLPGDRVVSVQLEYNSVVDHWNSLAVTITSKAAGKIDSKRFDFDKYIVKDNSHPRAADSIETPWAYENVTCGCSWGWYIVPPKSTKPIVNAVEDWVALLT